MTGKSEFSSEEWELILQGPPTAGVMVVTAERGGAFRETLALTADVIDLVAEQAVTGESASLAWLTLSNRARRLGLVPSVPAVQLLPTALVKAADAALA